MIVKREDFKGLLYIPNANDVAPNSNLLGNVVMLDSFIEKYEPESLILVLGYDLYKKLEAELENDGTISDPNSAYYKLLNGEGRYRGLKTLIASYIYYKFIEGDDSHYSGVGNIKEKAKGAKDVGFRDKAVMAWNLFYEHTIGGFMTNHTKPHLIYKRNAIGLVWDGDTNNGYQSLYSYLTDNRDEFPEATLNLNLRKLNYYGI